MKLYDMTIIGPNRVPLVFPYKSGDELQKILKFQIPTAEFPDLTKDSVTLNEDEYTITIKRLEVVPTEIKPENIPDDPAMNAAVKVGESESTHSKLVSSKIASPKITESK